MSPGESSPPARMSRATREAERVRRATAAVSADNSALAAALAHIGAAFDETAAICAFKIRVERWIQLPPDDPALYARFGTRAAMLVGRDLDEANVLIERCWRAERKAFAIASALGCGTRLSLDTLTELRLILRWLRFKGMQAEYGSAIASLAREPFATAAE